MSLCKAKYHILHLDEETDGTFYEKHTGNKLCSIVTWSASILVFVLVIIVIFDRIGIASTRDKEGEYINLALLWP